MRGYIGVFWLLTTLFTSLGFINAATTTTSGNSGFIKAPGRQFTLDGKPFRFVGTNAHWLQLLNEKDLNKTMHDISATGIKVVRTWAFNDVTEIPSDGVWFQVFHQNGTVEINMGENGLVRLDNIVKAAKNNKLHLLFALTNNWFRAARSANQTTTGGGKNPKRGGTTVRPVDRQNLPRNYLSNDYGGMDVYNQHFRKKDKKATNITHDQFYTEQDIVDAFSRYVATIVKRYANEPTVLGWELANDPRCSSGLDASKDCTPQTITKWTATIAAVVKQNDPNHLVSVGDGGFFCVGCPKVFPRVPTPVPSPAPGQKRHRRRGYLTEADLRRLFAKRAKRRLGVRGSKDKSQFRQVRGNWYAPREAVRKRQSSTFGSGFDGSFGVDSEDLANAPGVDFSSFQFFPDQNTFGTAGEIDLTDPGNIAQNGVDWVNLQAETANTFGKPATGTSIGVLNQDSQTTFVPFNPNDEGSQYTTSTTQADQKQIMDQVFNAANEGGVNVNQYQWGQDGLTASPGGAIRPQTSTTTTTTENTIGVSPDDGYAAYPDSAVRGSIAGAVQNLPGSGPTVKVRRHKDF